MFERGSIAIEYRPTDTALRIHPWAINIIIIGPRVMQIDSSVTWDTYSQRVGIEFEAIQPVGSVSRNSSRNTGLHSEGLCGNVYVRVQLMIVMDWNWFKSIFMLGEVICNWGLRCGRVTGEHEVAAAVVFATEDWSWCRFTDGFYCSLSGG